MDNLRDRMRSCQEVMRKKGADYMFLTPDSEMYYLSGFEKELHDRHFFLIVPENDEPFFFVPDVTGKNWVKAPGYRTLKSGAHLMILKPG